MTTLDPTSAALPCDGCGYDLRAQPADGRCPECGALVEESARLALVPRRPAWRDSDPRWRRRMVAGAWVLTLVPLMAVLEASGWAGDAAVPTPLNLRGSLALRDTFGAWTYEYFTFCIGVVLLFSKERNRRDARLDWSRRWGVTASYGVFLLGIVHFAFITALVVVGVGACFHSMPLRYQPAVTEPLIYIGAGWLLHGPLDTPLAEGSLTAFSAGVVMLACVPLYNALRSNGGPKAVALLVLGPLFVASLMQLANVGWHALGLVNLYARDEYYPFYFDSRFVKHFGHPFFRSVVEAGKWLACLTIAVWLSVAQVMTHARAFGTAAKRGREVTRGAG